MHQLLCFVVHQRSQLPRSCTARRITMFRAYRAASSMLASGNFDTPLLLEHVKRLAIVK